MKLAPLSRKIYRVSILCLLINISLWQHQVQAAPDEAALRQAITQQSNNPEAHLKLANFLLERLREQWAQRDPNLSGDAFQKQADGFQIQSQELIALYEKVISLQLHNVEARVNLAEVYFVFLSEVNQAEIYLKQALEIDPNHIQAQIAMAEYLFFFKGEREQALTLIEKALSVKPNHPDLSITLADLLTGGSLKAEDFAKAHIILEQALQAHPEHEGLRYMQGSVWYRQAVLDPQKLDQAKAQKALDILLPILNSTPDAQHSIEAAQIAQSMGQLPLARKILEQALVFTPQESQLTLLLGDYWLEQGSQTLEAGQLPVEANEAERLYRQLLIPARLNLLTSGQQVQLYYNLGLLAQLKAKSNPSQALPHYIEAEKLFRQALAIFDSINIINTPLQQELSRVLESIAQIHESSDPGKASTYYQQACSLKLESACNWLKQKGFGP